MSTILLIDDDEALRSMLRRALERGGYNVLEADNGRTGLRALSGATVDMVITDIIMPDMEGIETILALRKTHPDLKIIAMSGGGRTQPEGYLDVATRFGAAHVFRKPFKSTDLLRAIEDTLK